MAAGILAGLAAIAALYALARRDPPGPPAQEAQVRAPARSEPPHVDLVACDFPVPAGHAAQCGRLVTPETPGANDGRVIRLPFVIFKTRNTDGQPPLVYLHGGPGEPAGLDADGVAHWWPLIDQSEWLSRQDLIVFEQRGTGLAEPSLRCPEMQAAGSAVFLGSFAEDAAAVRWADAARACSDRLTKAGVQLNSYTTQASADDLAALLGGLGYASWNIYGVSYGTRLALAFLRQHPAGVRSVILDSVYPPNVHAYVEAPANAARAFAALFSDCASRTSCRSANPAIAASFRDLTIKAGLNPIPAPLRAPQATPAPGNTIVPLDPAKLIEVLFGGFYSWRDINQLPNVIDAAARGDIKPLEPLVQEAMETYQADDFSYGVFLSTECHDDWSFDGEAAVRAASSASDAFGAFARANLPVVACPVWPVGAAAPSFHEPVRSDVPVLLLTGEYDPITPPSWAVAAAATLPKSTVIRFPGIGHGILASHRCADQLALRFLVDPSKSPYHDCLVAVAAGPWSDASDPVAHKPGAARTAAEKSLRRR